MPVVCKFCEKMFSTQSNVNKHLRNIHKHKDKNIIRYHYDFSNIKCLSCASSFRFTSDLRYHLKSMHNEVMEEEILQFPSATEFQSWLNDLKHVEYVKRKIKGKLYYNCNRSGKYTVKKNELRKRALKSQGSCKIGYVCTSEIIVNVKSDGRYNVIYYKTYYGHQLELEHILPKVERVNIAAKLSDGITISRVMDKKRSSFVESTYSRGDLLTRRDVHNIKSSFQIVIQEGVRHQCDATSVDLWVKDCEGTQQVLFYKKQGEESVYFKKEDFCLIYMNNSQQVMLQKFSNIILIDSTHGLNMYDFELTTILVIDEYGEGYPAACMFSNSKDTKVFEFFFKVCKDQVGIISPNVFMTDITTVFYSAWEKVMGFVPNHLYCSWHIDRAWQSNLNKVCNGEKKKWVYKTIKVLQQCLNEDEFLNCLQKTIILLYEDSETRNFAKYFSDNYKLNYRQWAYCFRKNCGVNTNMHCESMHKSIKYFYLDGKVTKRLDKGINALLKYIRDKTVERIIKSAKGKYTSHIRNIHAEHRVALGNHLCMKDCGDNYWIINLTSSKQHTDVVVSKNVSDSSCGCHLTCSFCNICIHNYSCSCSDYSIKTTICRHIHFVVMKLNDEGLNSNINRVGHSNSTYTSESSEIKEHFSTLEMYSCDSKNTQHLKDLIINEANQIIRNINFTNDDAILLHSLKLIKNINNLIDIGRTTSFASNTNIPSKREPSNKNIAKQITFFSTKKKISKSKGNKKPNDIDVVNVKNVLNDNYEYISNSSFNDHRYVN